MAFGTSASASVNLARFSSMRAIISCSSASMEPRSVLSSTSTRISSSEVNSVLTSRSSPPNSRSNRCDIQFSGTASGERHRKDDNQRQQRKRKAFVHHIFSSFMKLE